MKDLKNISPPVEKLINIENGVDNINDDFGEGGMKIMSL